MDKLKLIEAILESERKDKGRDYEERGKNIVILQRGWVVVGDLFKNGEEYVLRNGAVVRRWGTTNGLGELASEGKRSETKLEPIPETKFHELTVIAMIKCEETKWKNCL